MRARRRAAVGLATALAVGGVAFGAAACSDSNDGDVEQVEQVETVTVPAETDLDQREEELDREADQREEELEREAEQVESELEEEFD